MMFETMRGFNWSAFVAGIMISLAFLLEYVRVFSWGSMLYFGFATLVAGASMEKYGGGWLIVYMVCYSSWAATTSVLVLFDLWRVKAKTKALLCHLGCCAVSLYFFSSILHIASADLPPFIPNSVNLGLIGSLIFQELSPDLDGQMLGVFANIFGIPYNAERSQPSRGRSPDPELGVRDPATTNTSSSTTSTMRHSIQN